MMPSFQKEENGLGLGLARLWVLGTNLFSFRGILKVLICFHIYAPFACLGGQKKMLVPMELELCQL